MQRANSAKSKCAARSGDTPPEASQMEKYFRVLAPEGRRLAVKLLNVLVKAQGKGT